MSEFDQSPPVTAEGNALGGGASFYVEAVEIGSTFVPQISLDLAFGGRTKIWQGGHPTSERDAIEAVRIAENILVSRLRDLLNVGVGA